MLAKAIEKLKSEMTKNISDVYIQEIGGCLVHHLNQNPQDAEKILVSDKTIGKSLDEMRKTAMKKKSGNFAMFTPEEGFKIIMKYFGIVATAPTTAQASAPIASAKVIQASSSGSQENSFDIKLEDLLA